MEKYSVLMSLYIKERPEYLRQSIESMLKQTVIPNEIVIVKDGPLTYELEEVLNDYKVKYPKLFNIVTSEVNLGLGLSLNLGLRNCRNEFVARMDTDDISLPQRCEKQLREFKNNNKLSIIGGYISEFTIEPSITLGRRIVPTNHDELKLFLKKRCPFNHVTVMFRKSEVLKSGNYQKWFWNEDYYMWIRMFESGCYFSNLAQTLVNVRVSSDMYKRRGGWQYFKSEVLLQMYMKNKKIIGSCEFLLNILIRFIVQILLPNKVREVVFKRLFRKRVNYV